MIHVFLGKNVLQQKLSKSESLRPILMTFAGPTERLYINQLIKFQHNILEIKKLMIISVLQMPTK